MRLPVRPTALGVKGLLFYAMILLAYQAAPYTNLFFLLLAFLSTLAVLGLLWTVRNLGGVAADVLDIKPAPAHTGHDVRLVIDTGAKRCFQLTCRVRVMGRWHTVVEIPAAKGLVEVGGRLHGLPRGVHPIEEARVLSRYPFGIFQRERIAPAPAEVVSYPVPADRSPWADPGAMAEALLGKTGNVGREPLPMGLRPWRSGDSLRDINWRATARRQQPTVVELDGEAMEGLQVVLDRRSTPEVLEEALGLLVTLLLLAQEKKDTVLLRSQGHAETYGPDHRPTAECLRWLAEAAPLPAEGPPPPRVPPTAVRLPVVHRREVARA